MAFKEQEHNRVYTEEMKVAAVREYLSGSKSQREISAKYGLRSAHQLRNWIKVYNSGRDFGHKMSGGSRMKQGRETTQEERIAIVKDCPACQKRSQYAAIFDKMVMGDKDAEERSRTTAGN